MSDRPYRVVKPNGIAWAARFVSEEGAWGGILRAARMADTRKNRNWLAKEGWKVKNVDEVKAAQ